MTQTMIIPTAEPFYFPGGEIGCLLIHGFTGTPKEMLWLGEYLAKQGHSVLGVRLTGHATRPEDMIRSRWRDWLASVEDGWHLLKRATSQIFSLGLSMGGVLSLLFASRFPVTGVVAMSTPYRLPPDPRLRLIKWLSWISPYTPKGPPDWHSPEGEEGHISYPKYPTRSIAELVPLMAEMRAGLPKVTMPVLLMHSRQDGSVDPANMQMIYDHLGSTDKRMLWIENSGHVITRDAAQGQVFQAAADFIKRVSQG